MGSDSLHITKRHLPHWTINRAAYFVTFRVRKQQLSITEQRMILEHIKHGNGIFYLLFAAIVLPDHVHVMLTPLRGYSLSRIMKGIKGSSARRVNLLRGSAGSLWQEESFDRIVRDQREFQQKLRYMLNNSFKNGLVYDPWRYHGWYFNEELIHFEKGDETLS